VSSNDPTLVKLLVENGSNIDSQNSFGETPLMLAIIKNYDGIAYELLKNGADVNIQNKERDTAFNLCVRYNRGKIQRYLASVLRAERAAAR
jgi:ankyrin repeat protein